MTNPIHANANKAIDPPRGDATEVVSRLREIEQVVQVRGHFERSPTVPDAQLHVDVGQPQVSFGLEGLKLTVVIEFSMTIGSTPPSAIAKVSEPAPAAMSSTVPSVVEVGAVFVAVYLLHSGETLKQEDLHAFATENGLFNVWPFWREFVANGLLRSGMPVFLMPPFRLGTNPSQATENVVSAT